jgi:hypothetical protein
MAHAIPPADLAKYGKGNDSIVAHISPREAMLLKLFGGSGTINPKTGLLEFYSGDSGDQGDGGDPGGDPGSGDPGSGSFGGFASQDAADADRGGPDPGSPGTTGSDPSNPSEDTTGRDVGYNTGYAEGVAESTGRDAGYNMGYLGGTTEEGYTSNPENADVFGATKGFGRNRSENQDVPATPTMDFFDDTFASMKENVGMFFGGLIGGKALGIAAGALAFGLGLPGLAVTAATMGGKLAGAAIGKDVAQGLSPAEQASLSESMAAQEAANAGKSGSDSPDTSLSTQGAIPVNTPAISAPTSSPLLLTSRAPQYNLSSQRSALTGMPARYSLPTYKRSTS